MSTDYDKDLFDEYGRPIVVEGYTTDDTTSILFDSGNRPIVVEGQT